MKRSRRVNLILLVLLAVTVGNYLRGSAPGELRNVDFVYLFAIGALTGILVVRMLNLRKKE